VSQSLGQGLRVGGPGSEGTTTFKVLAHAGVLYGTELGSVTLKSQMNLTRRSGTNLPGPKDAKYAVCHKTCAGLKAAAVPPSKV
jgi:hypothetical protein